MFEGLRWDDLFEHFDAITSTGYSVSVFTRWGETIDQVWIKSRAGEESEAAAGVLLSARAATRTVTRSLTSIRSTARRSSESRGRGPTGCHISGWASRRAPETSSSPSTSSPRAHGAAAVAAVLGISAAIRPALQVSEIRTIAADRLWMSPEYGRDTVAIHFTWSPEPDAVRRALARLEATLAPFDARPHWGKLFRADATAIAPLYERLGDFRALLERLDPRGAFRNDWLRDRVLGGD